MGTGIQQSSLEGLLGTYRASDMAVYGTISFLPLLGAALVDLSENSRIALPDAALNIPGVTANSNSLCVYTATNLLGPYQEIGATGTGGKQSFMLRAGSGVRSQAWPGAGALIFGDGSAWGCTQFSRIDANTVITQKHGTQAVSSSPVVSYPIVPLTLLSAEPGSSNSPNRVVFFQVGPKLTAEQMMARYLALTAWAAEVGILEDITVLPINPGVTCFDHTALGSVIPSTFRIARQLSFPATKTTPATATNAWPITDSFSRAQVVSYPAPGVPSISLPAWATSGFIPARGGRFWHIAWMNRGERGDGSVNDTPSSPISTTNFKGNDTFGSAIKRMTDAGAVKAGTECRPVYVTKRRAGGATLVHVAHMVGLAARDDTRLTVFEGVTRSTGWGYLDIAERWDIDPAKVMTCHDAIVSADSLFTLSGAGGYAVCYDIVLLSARNFPDLIAAGAPATRLGIIIDDEAANNWTPAHRLNLCQCIDQIVSAVLGMRWALFGQFVAGATAANNGWSRDNASTILALNALTAVFIIAAAGVPNGDAVAYLDEQAAMFFGPVGAPVPINYAKLGVSFTTGVGKVSILDGMPVSSQQMPLDMCDRVGDWIMDRGIKFGHVRRVGRIEGGTSDLFHNQQIMRGFRDLMPTD